MNLLPQTRLAVIGALIDPDVPFAMIIPGAEPIIDAPNVAELANVVLALHEARINALTRIAG